jgi:hypothetical protein
VYVYENKAYGLPEQIRGYAELRNASADFGSPIWSLDTHNETKFDLVYNSPADNYVIGMAWKTMVA